MLKVCSTLFKPRNTLVRTLILALKEPTEHEQVFQDQDEQKLRSPSEHPGPVKTWISFDAGHQRTSVLQFDLENYDANTDIFNFKEKLKSDIVNLKPRIIHMQHMERDGFMDMKMRMKQLGYDGYFQKTYQNYGIATFYEANI